MKVIKMKTWQEFRDFVDSDRQIMPIYWRGQRDPEWPLASKFERMLLDSFGGSDPGASKKYPYDGRYIRDGKPFWSPTFYRSMRDRYLHKFTEASMTLRGSSPPALSPDQWWALGRHYLLITPLLDWTEKPYIAAFFALIDLFQQMRKPGEPLTFHGDEVAIYRLFHNEKLEGDGLRVLKPQVDELARMHRQRSVFTWLDSERYFELKGFLDETGKGDLLTCILLSDQALMDGLRDLNAHGIDHVSLFPDLDGAAKYANHYYELRF